MRWNFFRVKSNFVLQFVSRFQVMDMCWLDDQFIVSGSKDAKMALWRITEDQYDSSEDNKESCPSYAYESPLVVKECRSAQKVGLTLQTVVSEMTFFFLLSFRYDRCASTKSTKKLQ